MFTNTFSVQVYVWPCVHIERDGMEHALHARRKYYGRYRYDFVHVNGGVNPAADPWLARVLAIVKVEVFAKPPHVEAAGFLPLAVVQWLQREDDLLPGMPTYKYLPTPQAIEIESIKRPVRLLEAPCRDEDDGTHRLCALPYGKTAAFNKLF